MRELAPGIRRLTFRFPFGPQHVHCYLLRGDGGGWTLVDTGIGVSNAAARWREAAAELDGPLERIVVTHFHPDHVGGAADAAAALGVPVFEGELDYAQCEHVWGDPAWSTRLADWMVVNGMPEEEAAELRYEADMFAHFIRFARDPEPLAAGDRLDGWEVIELPGHADGHLVLLRDGVLVAGDHLLPDITPTIGLYPDSRPDPVADYLESLERTIELAPALALPGHGDPIADPAARARELTAHHRARLEATAAALDGEPKSAYEVSIALFGRELPVFQRRFAVAESLAHLERLVREGAAAPHGGGRTFSYTGP